MASPGPHRLMSVVLCMHLLAGAAGQPKNDLKQEALNDLKKSIKQSRGIMYDTLRNAMKEQVEVVEDHEYLHVEFPGAALPENEFNPVLGGQLNHNADEKKAALTSRMFLIQKKMGNRPDSYLSYETELLGSFTKRLFQVLRPVNPDYVSKGLDCLIQDKKNSPSREEVIHQFNKELDECQMALRNDLATFMKNKAESLSNCSLHASLSQNNDHDTAWKKEIARIKEETQMIAPCFSEEHDQNFAEGGEQRTRESAFLKNDQKLKNEVKERTIAALRNRLRKLSQGNTQQHPDWVQCMQIQKALSEMDQKRLVRRLSYCGTKAEQLSALEAEQQSALDRMVDSTCIDSNILVEFAGISKKKQALRWSNIGGASGANMHNSDTQPEMWKLLQGKENPDELAKAKAKMSTLDYSTKVDSRQSKDETSKMEALGHSCYLGIFCVGASHSSENHQLQTKNLSFTMGFSAAFGKVKVKHEWFPYELFDSDFVRRNWAVVGKNKLATKDGNQYGIVHEIFICRDVNITLSDISQDTLESMSKSIPSVGLSIFGFGGGSYAKASTVKDENGLLTGMRVTQEHPFLCGFKLRKLPEFPKDGVFIKEDRDNENDPETMNAKWEELARVSHEAAVMQGKKSLLQAGKEVLMQKGRDYLNQQEYMNMGKTKVEF